MNFTSDYALIGALAVLAIAIYYWYNLFMNVKAIKDNSVKKDFDFCIEEAKIAEFSGRKKDALEWYYRALYNEIYHNTHSDNRMSRIESLKVEFEKKLTNLGGSWPILIEE